MNPTSNMALTLRCGGVLVVAALAATVQVHGQSGAAYLQLQGVPGTHTVAGSSGYFNGRLLSAISPGAHISEIVFVKKLDRTSPLLAEAAKTEKPFPTGMLMVPKGGGQYHKVTLSNVVISDLSERSGQETLRLRFSRALVTEVTAPALDGSSKADQGDSLAVPPSRPSPKPGRGGPVQFKAPGPLPDLLPLKGLTLGSQNTFIAWGQTAVLSSDAASAKQAGRCQFRYRYDTANQGKAAAAATTNRIRLDSENGPVLAEAPLPALAAGAQHTSSGMLPLAIGTWTLYVHVDDPKQVAESDEQNNLRRVRVRVEGSCQ